MRMLLIFIQQEDKKWVLTPFLLSTIDGCLFIWIKFFIYLFRLQILSTRKTGLPDLACSLWSPDSSWEDKQMSPLLHPPEIFRWARREWLDHLGEALKGFLESLFYKITIYLNVLISHIKYNFFFWLYDLLQDLPSFPLISSHLNRCLYQNLSHTPQSDFLILSSLKKWNYWILWGQNFKHMPLFPLCHFLVSSNCNSFLMKPLPLNHLSILHPTAMKKMRSQSVHRLVVQKFCMALRPCTIWSHPYLQLQLGILTLQSHHATCHAPQFSLCFSTSDFLTGYLSLLLKSSHLLRPLSLYSCPWFHLVGIYVTM